jgi:hypothetical protein
MSDPANLLSKMIDDPGDLLSASIKHFRSKFRVADSGIISETALMQSLSRRTVEESPRLTKISLLLILESRSAEMEGHPPSLCRLMFEILRFIDTISSIDEL